jgi:outer membrane receptor protein involved in Fe transport
VNLAFLRLCAPAFVGILATLVAAPGQLRAQSVPTGNLSGTTVDAQQLPAGGVALQISGPVTVRFTTDAGGRFSAVIPAGVYRIIATRAGFQSTEQDDVVIVAGTSTMTSIMLQPSSFSSLRTIGRVSTVVNARNAINTTSAAIATITGDSIVAQGQTTVNRALDEIPGVSIGVGDGFSGDQIANGASPLVTGVPTIRGGLPYETASLIDGHPISIGVYGTFNPAILSPYLLQDVEVVKGPGASAPNINYAIGGTINFRTLEPTRQPHQSLNLGIDQFGGQTMNVRATGTLADKFGYAVDYAATGTQGPDRAYDPEDPLNLATGAIINGQVACGSAAAQAAGACFPSVVPTNTNFQAASNLTAPLLLCCPNIPLNSYSRHELVKLRYSFTPTTSLTVSYLGAQLRGSALAADLFLFPSYFFGPPAGYNSSVYPSGFPTFQNLQGPSELDNNSNLYQADFRTALGPVSLNARYYISADNIANLESGEGPTPGTATFTGLLYGGVPLGNDATPTIFTGQPGVVTLENAYSAVRTYDVLHGYTVEADLPTGNNILSLSYDYVHTQSASDDQTSFGDTVFVYPGSGQSFNTIMLRDQATFGRLQATLSNYTINYTDRYTQDNGVTFDSSTHAYDAPRLALAYRASPNTSLRASTGFSIAPPYIQLLTNQSAPGPDRTPPTLFSVSANAGDLAPETAFGFDAGADHRINDTVISLDIYQTLLRNQFLSTTALTGTYTAPPGNPYGAIGTYPLYTTQTQNLGHARYAGIELAIHRDPAFGWGYKMQGYLQRAYAYDLPAGFYNTASGPYTANLGILEGQNYQATGQGYNSLSQARIPYSGGYGELNYRFRNNGYFLAGITYYGPNNPYNEPPFGVVNASLTEPLTKNISLRLASTNVTNAYSAFQYNIYGGIPTPLANGNLGYTAANVIGPSNTSLSVRIAF